jgi:phosphatidylglycerol:prolipoprotein diacylglycerol transferase
MYPHLFTIGPVTVPTYGVLFSLGLLAGVAVASRLAARSSLDKDQVWTLAWLCIFVGFVGARLVHVLAHLNYFLAHPLEFFRFWEGWAFLGGPIAALLLILWYAPRHHMPIWKVLDVFTPPLPIGLVFARLGCLMAGCCYGKPTGCTFGITLHGYQVDPQCRGVPLHPTQLYEAAGSLLLFFWLLRVFKRKTFDGQVFLSFFIAYPVFRSIIECFRGDSIRGFVVDGVLSTSQLVSILIFIPAFVLMVVMRKVSSRTPAAPPPQPPEAAPSGD